MAEISKLCLQSLKDRIRRFALMHSDPDDVDTLLMIVSVHRYLVDPEFTTQTGLICDAETEAYDVIVSDLTNKLKCILDPTLNFLVRKGELLVGSRVSLRLSDCTVYYNELDMDGDSLLIINKLRVVGITDGRINTDLIPYCGYPDNDTDDVPLVKGRGTYLSLWNDEDLYGRYIEEHVPLESGVGLKRGTISIQSLADRWKNLKRPYPALLVKVIHKSRLRFYGKPQQRDKWPYQIHLTVADESAVCTVVLWNEMALELHSSLTEGAVMRVVNYTVRRRFELMSHPTLRVRDLNDLDLELGLNKHHPRADVTLVDPEDVCATWRLPTLCYNFFTRQNLSSLPDQYNVDVIGVVTFVGRMERIRKRLDSHQFWQYRWVELMDATSHRPLRVEIYATSQSQTHNALLPYTILVCTQMRLIHNLDDLTSSHQQRALHVTTTNESQLYIHSHDISGPYRSHPVVKQLMRWSRSPEGQRAVKAAVSVGGHYVYPPLPTSLRGYQAGFTVETPLALVTGDAMARELSQLCCHEHRRLTMQGFLVNIRFVARVAFVGNKRGTSQRREGYSLRSRKQTEAQKKKPGRKRKNACHDEEDPSVETTSILVDRTWPGAGRNVEMLGQTAAPPSFYRRHYSVKNASAIRSCLGMPASTYRHTNVKTRMEDLPKCKSSGHFVVTMTDLNLKMTLHTLFPLPDTIPQNATVAGLLSGAESSTVSETSVPTPSDITNLLQTARHCHDKRMLFVLDLFRHQGDSVEVVLNRAFIVR